MTEKNKTLHLKTTSIAIWRRRCSQMMINEAMRWELTAFQTRESIYKSTWIRVDLIHLIVDHELEPIYECGENDFFLNRNIQFVCDRTKLYINLYFTIKKVEK